MKAQDTKKQKPSPFERKFVRTLKKCFAEIDNRKKSADAEKTVFLDHAVESLIVFAHRMGYEVQPNRSNDRLGVRRYASKADKASLDSYLSYF